MDRVVAQPAGQPGRRSGLRAWQAARGLNGALRGLLFRVLAILMGLATLLLSEGLLRLGGWGGAADLDDPYVGFTAVKPLFELDSAATRYQIPASRHSFFGPESFAAVKDPREFRIFCLGGSTVQGRPYALETSFTTWLELSLRAADPSRHWEVVNCGGVSYASYRLLPIMKELLQYEPDLFILYTGHNEFLEERTYAQLEQRPQWIKTAHYQLSASRLYGILRQLYATLPSRPARALRRTLLPAEASAMLDYQDGLQAYHRDDVWRSGVIEHFETNLLQMVRIAQQNGVPSVLVNPVSNLKDSPPFKTESSRHLTGEQLTAFNELWTAAKAVNWSQLDRKAELLRAALALDDRHADAHFLLARVYEAAGRHQDAKQEYLRAKDEDVCPLRMLEPMHKIVVRLADLTATPLVDVRRMFAELAEHGIPGDEHLIDHVHPRIDGHQRIAECLFDDLVRQRLLSPRAGWRAKQKHLYDERWHTLEHNYFPESVARLRGLQLWTQGRASRLKTAD